MCGVAPVLSGAVSGGPCDLDRVSRGDIVVSVDKMSLSGGGDAVVSGVSAIMAFLPSHHGVLLRSRGVPVGDRLRARGAPTAC